MKTLTATAIIVASMAAGYMMTGMLYIAASAGGMAICVLCVYSLWRDDCDIRKEQEQWRRLTAREREDRHMMLTRRAQVEESINQLGKDYVFSPDYRKGVKK